jgi:DNA-binding transcriptional LysR family regulator
MRFVNLEVDLLRTFVTAVETGSFARAADIVARTPSAVSLQIDRLEQMCGHPLFRRDGRRFVLTPAGEKLLVYARRLLAINDEAVGTFQVSIHRQVVRLGIPEDIASGCLPDALQRFSVQRPDAYITVQLGRSATLVNAVERGELDLAIAYGNRDRPSALHAADQPIRWIGSSRQEKQRKDTPVRLVLFGPPCCFRTAALEALDRAALQWEIVFESPNLLGQWAAVKAGLGVSVRLLTSVPTDLIALGPQNGLPALGTIPLTLHAAHQLSPAAHEFRDLLLRVLTTLAEPQITPVVVDCQQA